MSLSPQLSAQSPDGPHGQVRSWPIKFQHPTILENIRVMSPGYIWGDGYVWKEPQKWMTIAATSDTLSTSGLPKADQKFWALGGAPSKSRRSHDFSRKSPRGKRLPDFLKHAQNRGKLQSCFSSRKNEALESEKPTWFQNELTQKEEARFPNTMEEQDHEYNDKPLPFWANSWGSITEQADDHCKKLTSVRVQSSTASPWLLWLPGTTSDVLSFIFQNVPKPARKSSPSCQL